MKKWILWFLALSLLLPALPGAARAEEVSPSPAWSLEDRWDLSLDGETLTCGDRVYHRYLLPPGNYLRPELLLIHEVKVPTYTGTSLSLVSAEGNEDFIFLCVDVYDENPARVYVTDAGARQLDQWCRGEYSRMTLWYKKSYQSMEAPISESLVAQLDAAPITAEIDVMTLREAPCYRILGHDQAGILQHPHGEIYQRHDGYYYVNLDVLDNTHFDGEGNLSYRSGTVPMAKITGALRVDVENALSAAEEVYASDKEYLSDYLDDGSEKQGNPTALILIFTTLSLLLGFLLPAALLIVALVKALSKKAAGRRRWYLLMTLASVWIGYALYILVSLLTAAS